MSVVVSTSTVVSPLWPVADAGDASSTVPLGEEGVFLSFYLGNERSDGCGGSGSGSGSSSGYTSREEVAFVAFHPVDETCFVFGTSSGKAYGVSLQDNRLFLLADLGAGGLRCGTFCPGYLTSPIVVVAKCDNSLVFVDWQRGTLVQEVSAASLHAQPILRLVTGQSTEALFCAVSADAFTCWEPAPREVDVGGNADLHVLRGGQVPVMSGADVKLVGAAQQTSSRLSGSLTTPVYTCTASAIPTQCVVQLKNDSTSAMPSVGKAAHRFLGLHIVTPTLLLSVEANNILSLWSRTVEGLDESPRVPAVNRGRDTATTSDASTVAGKRGAVQLLQSAAAPATLRVRCSAQCGPLIALGGDAVTTSSRGTAVEPVAAFIDAQTLTGAGVVRLPGGTGGGSAAAKGNKASVLTVVQVHALQADLVACLLSSGVVHVVLPSTFHLIFSLSPPVMDGDGRLSRASVAPPAPSMQRSGWSFKPSGPTFGALFKENKLLLLHLPTARQAQAENNSTSFDAHVIPAAQQQRKLNLTTQSSTLSAAAGASESTSHRVAVSASGATLAQPFLHHRATSRLRTSNAANSLATAADVSFANSATATKNSVAAALAVLSVCRPVTSVPKKGFADKWVDVNLVDMRFSDSEGVNVSRSGSAKVKDNGAGSASASAEDSTTAPAPRVESVWSDAKFCDTLPAASCQYNMEQLHAHLLKYGVFPHTYRPVIWRFLAGLPARARTASQFAAVARRPPHVAVAQLMQPFPLPPSRTRQCVEEALSCLLWLSPVLALASYLPVLVYPLAMLYRDDVQTVVELVLLFFCNAGKDFFTCHPAGPPPLLAWMERELQRMDAVLAQHLDAVGAGVAVWGWELMTTFYTDVLSGAEWLQVMDHAILASPLWLFAMHVTLVRTRLRAPLMAAVSADEVRRVLSHPPEASPTPSSAAAPLRVPLKFVVEETYRLSEAWMQRVGEAEVLRPYAQLRTLPPSFEYPSEIPPHDPVVLAEKMRELALVQRHKNEEAEAARRQAALRQEAESVAAKEALFLQQQRARVAAKYDVSTTAWQVQVALERSRQAQEAEEQQLRWDMLQSRTRTAEELQALHAEMGTVEAQLRHDMVDRHMEQLKWGLATHITDEELARLQREAVAQVERAVQHIETDVAAQAQELARFNADPVLQVDATVVEEDKEEGKGEEEAEQNRGASRFSEDDEQTAAGATDRRLAHFKEKGAASQSDRSTSTPQSSFSASAEPSLLDQGATAPQSPLRAQPHGLSEEEAAHHNGDDAHDDDDPSAVEATNLSAETETYASPSKEPLSEQRRHHPPRPVPPRRHAAHATATASSSTLGKSTSSSSSGSGSTMTDPTLQSFVELRNRVLRRLQLNSTTTAGGSTGKLKLSAGAQRHASPHDRQGQDAEASTAPFSASSYYYTSDTYDSRTNTISTATTNTAADNTSSAASTGRYLFDKDPLRSVQERSSRAKAEDHKGVPHTAPQDRRHVTSTTPTTSTTATASSFPTTSANTASSYSWSYYDYSTGRSSKDRSSGGSFPRSTTSASYSTSQE